MAVAEYVYHAAVIPHACYTVVKPPSPPLHTLSRLKPLLAVCGQYRNPFDSVLIPTKLVIDTCHATFLELEGEKLGKDARKAAWERRVLMLASNAGEGQPEAFVIAKYDLVPENLVDTVQVRSAKLLQ